MKTRTVDEILSKIIEMEPLQNYLLNLMETKTKPNEVAKVRQAVTSVMSYIDGLRYSLGEIKI
jgi:hypothetical protein